ncbi:MAG: right-handed parallel beta-helix repeat-containing protein [Kiloniellales bacterium]
MNDRVRPSIWFSVDFQSCSRLLRMAALVGAFAAPAVAQATDRLVAPNGRTDIGPKITNDCTLLPCPLRHAVQQAQRGDTILIQSGPIAAHGVVVNKDLTIKAASCPSRIRIDANGRGRHFHIGNSQPATVTLSCLNLVGGVDSEGGAIRVGAQGALIFDNGKIQAASATRGGAIFNAGGSVTVRDSELTDNRASPTAEGGAIMSEGGSVTVRRSEIADNLAMKGGAIAGQDTAVVVTASTLSGNRALDGDGGALWLHRGTLLVGNATVLEANTAPAHTGGAVYAFASVLTFQENATLVENMSGTGGAIRAIGSTLTIEATKFERNRAAVSGGGVAVDTASNATITLSTFSGNTAAQDGGALLRESFGRLTIRESAFEGNNANRGGALADMPGTLSGPEITTTIKRSLFAENEADSLGGAIYHRAGNGHLHVVNTTFSENRAATDGAGIFNEAGGEMSVVFSTFVGNEVTAGNNLAGGVFSNQGGARVDNSIIAASVPRGCSSVPLSLAGNNNLTDGCEPDFEPIGTDFNRGSVTGLATALGGAPAQRKVYPLLSGSNAIDLGRRNCTDDVLGERVTEDQIGNSRPLDGDDDGIARCDVGAYERSAPRVTPLDPQTVPQGPLTRR